MSSILKTVFELKSFTTTHTHTHTHTQKPSSKVGIKIPDLAENPTRDAELKTTILQISPWRGGGRITIGLHIICSFIYRNGRHTMTVICQ